LGRLERRAWFNGLKYNPDKGTFDIRLGIDEARVNRADLEIHLEEYLDGDLAAARRIDLGEIPMPSDVITASKELVVPMPTIGSGAGRELKLFDRDGLLLDSSDRAMSMEGYLVKFSVSGVGEMSFGKNYAKNLTLLERLGVLDEVESAYRKWLEEGLEGRVIDDPSKGLPGLTGLLRGAIGELLVLDPYFGWDVVDWDVLADVRIPVRVLTGHGRLRGGAMTLSVTQPPPAITANLSSFEVRSWQSPRPPWHDRVYIWTGRGLTVGTSPSGLGNRVARIDRLNAVEAEGWRSLFETYWQSPTVVKIF
jgi:hypothetical protein